MHRKVNALLGPCQHANKLRCTAKQLGQSFFAICKYHQSTSQARATNTPKAGSAQALTMTLTSLAVGPPRCPDCSSSFWVQMDGTCATLSGIDCSPSAALFTSSTCTCGAAKISMHQSRLQRMHLHSNQHQPASVTRRTCTCTASKMSMRMSLINRPPAGQAAKQRTAGCNDY